jgi:lysophospholipase L1-like esterase
VDLGKLALLSFGGGLTSAALAGAGLLLAEAVLTARRGFLPAETAPVQDGAVGDGSMPELRLALLGDAMAAGVGVMRSNDTVGRQVAQRLARAGYRVQLSTVAVAGSRTADLGPQVSRALLRSPNIAIVLVGAGDATHGSRLESVRGNLGDAVARMRAAHVPVVVGCCPDLGAAPCFPQPLRSVVGWRGMQVAAAEMSATELAGGLPVDLAAATGGIFRADRGTFSEDGFHPSPDGYRLWAEALLPSTLNAAQAHATL